MMLRKWECAPALAPCLPSCPAVQRWANADVSSCVTEPRWRTCRWGRGSRGGSEREKGGVSAEARARFTRAAGAEEDEHRPGLFPYEHQPQTVTSYAREE